MARVPDISSRRQLTSLMSQNAERLARRQLEIASGLRLHRPSDDLLSTARALMAKSDIREVDGRISATERTDSLATAMETALTNVQDILTEVRVLATQAANDASGDIATEPIAQQINQLIESLVEISNRKVFGVQLFGGVTNDVPYTPVRDVNGDITAVTPLAGIDEPLVAIVGDEEIELPVTGPAVFAGAGDVFATLIALRDAVRADDSAAITAGMTALETDQDAVTNVQAGLGGVSAKIRAALTQLRDRAVSRELERSRAMDVDMAEAAVALSADEASYQAALQMAARVSNLSLMNLL